jgi:hypothetical protein
MTPFSLEALAREDALLDQQFSEPLWYPMYVQWAKTGEITPDDWQRYQAAYLAARGAALPPLDETPE